VFLFLLRSYCLGSLQGLSPFVEPRSGGLAMSSLVGSLQPSELVPKGGLMPQEKVDLFIFFFLARKDDRIVGRV